MMWAAVSSEEKFLQKIALMNSPAKKYNEGIPGEMAGYNPEYRCRRPTVENAFNLSTQVQRRMSGCLYAL